MTLGFSPCKSDRPAQTHTDAAGAFMPLKSLQIRRPSGPDNRTKAVGRGFIPGTAPLGRRLGFQRSQNSKEEKREDRPRGKAAQPPIRAKNLGKSATAPPLMRARRFVVDRQLLLATAALLRANPGSFQAFHRSNLARSQVAAQVHCLQDMRATNQ
jgi:hypothetical protein